MRNAYLDAFMERFAFEGLTFDDVSLVTRYADFLPAETDVRSRFSRRIPLNIPFVSAAMDTVTESEMAIAIARLGGIGVIHKNLSPKEQASEVSRVKHYLNGLITDPVVFRRGMLVRDVLEEKRRRKYQFAGFPIVDSERRLVGILTARDVKFLTDFNVPVDQVMTHDVVVGGPDTTMEQAFQIMLERKIGKLPIVDDARRLVGLYSFHDVRTLLENMEPAINRDAQHQLRVAAAVGPYDEERIELLVRAGVDALVIDTAHGHSKGVIETVRLIKKNYRDVDVVAGNVATSEGGKALLDAGTDAVKVGIGPGSICTTRVVAGVGVPQLTAIYDVAKAIGDAVPIIADGGIAYSGDVAKAIAVGAHSVMVGSILAGTEESPGERVLHQGRTYVIYRGMGSVGAMQDNAGSRERYGQPDVESPAELVPQGIEAMVPYRGKAADVLHQYVGGLRYSLGYCGVRTLQGLREEARLIRMSSAGLHEAHPHDVRVTKDAPNYRAT